MKDSYGPASYIPVDRRQAMAVGETLLERTQGAALFADISGFTNLTEALSNELGDRRGAEELSKHLNRIYGELIGRVDSYKGSVISFSGDAITCWFDQDNGLRAAACALAMQEAMGRFATISTPGGAVYPLAIKVSVASGTAVRFQIGDPQIQYLDILAGATLDRLAAAEHHAQRGEVIVASEVAEALGDCLDLDEWRNGDHPGERFGVVSKVTCAADGAGWPNMPEDALGLETIRPWILQSTFDRVCSGQFAFQSELRPLVVLFLNFSGIDYDNDPSAGEKLDAYIRWVQRTATSYDGSLLQVTFGDKGSYLYIIFGAPNAHEDDVDRAALTALELRELPADLNYIKDVRIGVSRGRMWVGPYGGPTRSTYGVLGDHTNLAARLMQNAPPGGVLVSEDAKKDAVSEFVWKKSPALKVKGKTEPVNVYLLVNVHATRSFQFEQPHFRYPLVGRKPELTKIEEKLELSASRRGQVLAITAEAGLGKSRLVFEAIRLASSQDFTVYYGECQSYGTNTSYLVWRNIWQAFFRLDPEASPDRQIQVIEDRLGKIDPDLIQRLPLLGSALNLPIPDNPLTQSMDARLRKDSLEALLVDCLRVEAQAQPLMLVLEDCHWLDLLSNDLLSAIGRAITNLPVMIVVAYRPLELEREKAFEIASLPYTTVMGLTDFTPEEAEQLIALKLSELDSTGEEIPKPLIDLITERAQGNPFYIEELINYLEDLKLDIHDPESLRSLDLPSSLYSLILSRIDTLLERQKIILKAASIIGRLFKLAWLWGVDPSLGESDAVLEYLDDLSCLDLTPLDQPEPISSYYFKHIVTWEVAYKSQPFNTRSLLHGHLGHFIESTHRAEIDQYVDLLAYHFDLSQENDKKCEYLRKAGEAAQSKFANSAAIDYYRRLLPLLSDQEKAPVLIRLGQVYELVGDWPESRQAFESALEIAEHREDKRIQVECQSAMGSLLRKQGEYNEATGWFKRAQQAYQQLDDPAGLSHVLAESGEVFRLQGDYSAAQSCYQQSLQHIDSIIDQSARLASQAGVLKSSGTLANQQGDPQRARQLYERALEILRKMDDRVGVAILLNNLGMVAMFQEDYPAAQPLFEESLAILRQVGYRWAVGQLLNNLGMVVRYRGQAEMARTLLEESVEVRRDLGDKWGIANSLSSLSNLLIHQGEFASVRGLLEESLRINVELGDRTAIAYCLEDFASLAAGTGEYERAWKIAGAASALRENIGCPLPLGEQTAFDSTLTSAKEATNETSQAGAWEAGHAMEFEAAIAYALAS